MHGFDMGLMSKLTPRWAWSLKVCLKNRSQQAKNSKYIFKGKKLERKLRQNVNAEKCLAWKNNYLCLSQDIYKF